MNEKKCRSMCGKCASKITESTGDGSSILVGCKEQKDIHNYDDAKKLCPVVKESEQKNEGGLDHVCNKITTGYVVQEMGFNENSRLSCTRQEFIAGDVNYEDPLGNVMEIDTTKEDYQPFEMVQPNTEIVVIIEGGIIQHIAFPSGLNNVTVVVKDYDTDGSKDVEKDSEGDEYVESRWANLD